MSERWVVSWFAVWYGRLAREALNRHGQDDRAT